MLIVLINLKIVKWKNWTWVEPCIWCVQLWYCGYSSLPLISTHTLVYLTDDFTWTGQTNHIDILQKAFPLLNGVPRFIPTV